MPSASDSNRLARPLSTRAAFEPSTWDEESRSVEIVWTTGARGLRRSLFDGDYYEELEVSAAAVDLSRLNNGAPFLAAHEAGQLSSVIGVVHRAWIDGSTGRARIRFSRRPEVDSIVRDVRDGILVHTSVGYDPIRYREVGEQDGLPVRRAVRWLPLELSLVPLAFDDAAVVRGASSNGAVEVHVKVPIERDTDVPAAAVRTSQPAIVAAPSVSVSVTIRGPRRS